MTLDRNIILPYDYRIITSPAHAIIRFYHHMGMWSHDLMNMNTYFTLVLTCMNHEQSVYQGTIGYFSRITNANKYLVKARIQNPTQGLGLAYILKNRKQQQHAADVVTLFENQSILDINYPELLTI